MRKLLKFGTGVPIIDSELSKSMRIEPSVMTAAKKTNRRPVSLKNAGFERKPDLSMALSEVPDVRAEMVARGKALIADPNYPSKAQLRKVAEVIAANWQK